METSVEFSRRIEAEKITTKPWTDRFEATEAECEALSRRFGLESLKNVKAEVTLRRVSGGKMILAEGVFDADVTQKCVVTLDPIRSHIKSEFKSMFTENNVRFLPGAEVVVSAEDEESPEPIENGMIDMGELVAQHLSLELNPYPRKLGVKVSEGIEKEDKNGKTSSPFDILAKLKKKGENKDEG